MKAKPIRLKKRAIPALPQVAKSHAKGKGASGVSRAKLTNHQVFSLYRWVETHKTTVKANDDAMVARMASADLKVPFNASHVRGAREGMGLPKFGGGRARSNGDAVTSQKLELLMDAVFAIATIHKLRGNPAIVAAHIGFGRKPLGEE